MTLSHDNNHMIFYDDLTFSGLISKCCIMKIRYLITLPLFLFNFQVNHICEAKKRIFANVVWRHGDRSYIMTYPNDPYRNQSIWRNGPGELTKIGIKEQYELGRYLRSRYNDLLNDTYTPKEIYVRSTDKDRTIMSAQSNMAGLYPPTAQELWNGSKTFWQPVPIHSVPLFQDKLLRYPKPNCPNYDDVMAKIKKSSWYVEHEKNFSHFYSDIKNWTGSEKPYNLSNVWEVEDNLFCLHANNYKLPKWATTEVMTKLKKLNSLGMGLYFTDVNYKYRDLVSQMQGGVLLKEIIANMTAHIEGRQTYSMIAYSAHDTTLTALLVSLGNYDWVQPKYASTVMIELYEDDNKYFVEIYYRKTREGDPELLKFYDCNSTCPFESFVNISQRLIPEDWEKICGVQHKTVMLKNYIWLMVLMCVILLILIILVGVLFCKRRPKHQYQHVNTSEDEVPI